MEQIKRITGDSVHLISVNGDKPLKLSQISTGGGGGARPHYHGQTEFTPSTVTQTAQTEGLIVDSDITVNAMPLGSAKTPTVNVEANPTITMDGNGLVTASYAKTESVTPSVTAGYVSAGTSGNVTFRGSSTYQLPSQAATAITPTESAQTAVAAGKYTTGEITVNAIPSNYVGTGVARKDSTDLTASGATVTAPAGYYANSASKSLPNADPWIEIEDGFFTESNEYKFRYKGIIMVEESEGDTAGYLPDGYSKSSEWVVRNAIPANTTVTPSKSAQTIGGAYTMMAGAVTVAAVPEMDFWEGYIQRNNYETINGQRYWKPTCGIQAFTSGWLDAGTYGEVDTFPAVAANTTITPTTSAQTIGGANTMMEGAVTVSAMPTGTEGTPTAAKGAVSNHAVTVTPSVTNQAGYISGGTKTGAAVSVSASELVSGSETKTANGTYDVTNLSEVVVDVPTPPSVEVEPLSVTDNGTYTAPSGRAYSPVTVNVSGGVGGSAEPNDVEYIDYDGIIVYSYSAADFAQLTAHPANPSHDGLVAQGWNWSLSDAQAYVAEYGGLVIGQMYITESGDTEIDVVMPEGRLSPTLTIAVNGSVTVDWGDGTTPNTVTGASLTTQLDVSHSYTSAGSYTIKIHAVSGSFTFYGSTVYLILRKNNAANENRVYANCVKAVRLGAGITSIENNAFNICMSLISITIPSGVTSIGSSAFNSCYSLASVTIPSGVTSIGAYVFAYCYSLASIAIPSGVTSIGSTAFSNCFSLASISIPSGVTSIGSSAFNYCYSLASIAIPSGVTSIWNNAFSNCNSLASISIPSGITSIGSAALNSCFSLASVTIPSGVTSIGDRAFANCFGIAEYHVKPTTPPTISSNTFSNIVSDCKIYVPAESLEAYKTASNWSKFASKIVGE